MPSPLFYLAEQLSSASVLVFSMYIGVEEQNKLQGKGIHSSQGNGILLFQFTGSIFPKRKL